MQNIIDYVNEKDPNFSTNHHWYAGISNDPSRRCPEHENEKNIVCNHFKSWNAGSEENARKIEKALEAKGFAIYSDDLKPIEKQASTSSTHKMESVKTEESKYVYVFQAIED